MSDQSNPQYTKIKKSRSDKTSWRTTSTESPTAHNGPNWRDTQNQLPDETIEKQPLFRRRLFLITAFLAGFGFLSWFVYYLLTIQVQTPFLAVAGGPYASPFAPNAWALEDLENFFTLHEKTLSVTDLTSHWQAKESGIRELQFQLDRVAEQGRRTGVVILYLSMHGVTDAEGNPCLIPPNASPYQSESWLPMNRLFDEIAARNIDDDTRILLILDSSRMQVNWQLGLLYNGFTEGLEAVVRERITEDSPLKNLVVLNSTSAGEVGGSSQDLQASVFGYYLRNALAGEADDEAHGGDGNRKVSLHELRDYLQTHVDRWAKFHRGDRQRPLLLPAQTPDFTITWALAPENRSISSSPDALAAPPVPEAEISQLWIDYARYAAKQPYDQAPVEWHQFERQLLWLSQANRSGRQYERVTRQLKTLLSRKTEQWDRESQLTGSAREAEIAGTANVTRKLSTSVHSLPLAKQFATISGVSVEEVSMAFAQFHRTPNPGQWDQLLKDLSSRADFPSLTETQLPRALQLYGSDAIWNQPRLLQTAFDLRDQAEQLAAPKTPGIHYWTRPSVDAGDDSRRRGEDLLFVGDQSTSDRMTKFFQTAKADYSQADEIQEIVEHALQVRNQTVAQLPWLAEWYTSPHPLGTAVDPEETTIIARLLALIAATHKLSHLLDGLDTQAAEQAEKTPLTAALLKRQTEEVHKGFAEFQALFDKRYNELLFSKQTDPQTLRAIENLLRVPLLPKDLDELGRNPSQQREALVQKAREIAAARHEEFFSETEFDALEQEGEASVEEDEYVTELDRMVARWKNHPALALIITNPPDPAEVERVSKELPRKIVARMGGRLRRHLLTIPEQSLAITNKPPTTVPAYRRQLSEVAGLARNAAWLEFPQPETDPIVRLQQFDLQQLFVWHGNRSLEDFWGIEDADSTAFFEVAARDYLNNAALIFNENPLWDQQRRELMSRLDLRKRASEHGLITRATNSIVIQPDQEISTEVVVAPGPANGEASLPEGFATVLLEKNGHPLPSIRKQIELPLKTDSDDGVQFPMRIPASAVDGDSATLRATTLFRGHSFETPFQLVAMGGQQVSAHPRSYDTAQIAVKSFLNRRSSIVFILDSSATMYDEIPRENSERTVRKLEAARSALNQMLGEIVQLPRTHVGVFFYGHRVAARPDADGVLQRQKEYRDKYPFDDSIRPFDDVERVLELGRFSSVYAGQIAERLELLKPWGETPLYLALVQAINEFDTDDADAEKNIVVITDGLNYQFNPSTEAYTTVTDVLTALRGKNIHVDIVGLGISERDAETAQREFGQIARATNGKYVAVDRASRLIDSLKSVLEPREYTITDQDGGTRKAKVRQAVTVTPHRPRPEEYRVQLGSLEASVPLAGGESAELVVSSAEDRLECVRFEENSPRFVPLIVGTPARVSEYELGVHQPKVFSNGVRFEVSLQSINRLVPYRPQEIWMEVTPRGPAVSRLNGNLPDQKTYPRYIYYDANFSPDRPVPVIEWIAEDWPVEARMAEVRFWCNFRNTKPVDLVSWDDVLKRSIKQRVDNPIPNVSGITWQLSQRGNRIGIVERHSAGSPGINALKVDLLTKALPSRIVRRFDAQSGLVSHTFEFSPADMKQIGLGDKPQIRFTTREELTANSYRLDEPVLVEIGEASDVIQPNSNPVLRVP